MKWFNVFTVATTILAAGCQSEQPGPNPYGKYYFIDTITTFEEFRSLIEGPAFADADSLRYGKLAFGDRGLEVIASSSHVGNLRRVYAEDTGATDIGLRALAYSATLQLEQLYLSRNSISADGLQSLMSGPATSRLTVLRLNGNQFGDRGIAVIASAEHALNLRELFVANVAMTDDGLLALCASRHLRSLEWLEITTSRVTPKSLLGVLDPNCMPKLEFLEVDKRNLGPGFVELAAQKRPGLRISAP